MKKILMMLLASVLVLNACNKDDSAQPESDQKQITSFTFSSLDPIVNGEINQENNTISLVVPYGTDVRTLTPAIQFSSGATVSPSVDEAIDFTNPVAFTVTAEDGSLVVYTVTVLVEESKASFTITSVDWRGDLGTYVIGDVFGSGFTINGMKVIVFNDEGEYTATTTLCAFENQLSFIFAGVTIPIGKYKLKISDVNGIVITDDEFDVTRLIYPSISSISETVVESGGNVTIIGQGFSSNLSDNHVYIGDTEVDVVSASKTELVVKVPDDFDPGQYTLYVNIENEYDVYSPTSLKVVKSLSAPVITSLDTHTYDLGQTITINGTNLKQAGSASNINFVPFIGGGATIVRSGVANADGTELTYTLPNDFPTGTYVIVVEVGLEYSNEYDDVIKIQ